ncbi:DUF1552 domain-containing protein [bacterium]|nr:DUF1552 domain-containing protein [bacterium]
MYPELSRRGFLRGTGIALALPSFEVSGQARVARPRRRMVAINLGLGLHAPNMVPNHVPDHDGGSYEASPYLSLLEEFQSQYTFISGSSHPGVSGGHQSGKSFLTAAKHPNSAGFQNSISIDQLAAEKLGSETRFASLSLSSSGPGLSWSRAGVEVPSEVRPSRLFQKLFMDGKPQQKAAQVQRLADGLSVLDVVGQQAAEMRKRLSTRDKRKLEQYFHAVREAETRITKSQEWAHHPKPVVQATEPRDEPDRKKILERSRQMYDMIHLALETDSTRFLTYFETGMNAVPTIPGVNTDYHMLSHHGKEPSKIKQLSIVESEMIQLLGEFLGKLQDSQESGLNLLDQTMVLFGSNLGNASSHDTRNLPILLVGGGFRHRQHLAFDQQNNYPLPKLYISMLQQLGIETDRFADCTGTMQGIESLT